MTKTQAELSGLTFGCELEYEGIGKPYAARLIAEVTGGRVETEDDGGVIRTSVRMRDGRVWSIVRDGSLHGTSCESVTPILTIEDLPMLEKVVAALRRGGAIVNERTGLHIHVGMRNAEPVAVKNLVRTFYKQEELILKAAGTRENRLERYTRRTDHSFVERICRDRNPTWKKLNCDWFGTYTTYFQKYESHRYSALNLNNLWNDKGTVEFRFWEGTTDHKRVAANVLFCLLLVARAKDAKASSAKSQRPYNESSAKYDFRVFLLRLGANGPMFKSMRKILMANLPGSAAWKDGRHDRPRAETEVLTGTETNG